MTSHERKPRLHTRIRRRLRGWNQFRRILRNYRRATLDFGTDRGTRVMLLTEGRAAFDAMLAAIREARRSIHLEMYQFESDGIGWSFARALMEKARAGVAVRVVYDAAGSYFASSAMWIQLEAAGAEVHCYHPLSPWRRGWQWNRRDHRKILVVDGRIGFTGGMNIADDHLPAEEGGGGWRDTHLQLEGPAVADLQLIFLRTWIRLGGVLSLVRDLFKVRPYDDGLRVRVVSNRTFRTRRSIRLSVLRTIERAQQSVHITHAYFIPDSRLSKALEDAVAREVDVHLIVPERSDVAIALAAGRAAQPALLSKGVRISRRLGRVLHSKTLVVDGHWVSLGSCNLNYRSFFHNQEVNVEIDDEAFGAKVEALFRSDLSQSVEITVEDLDARSLPRKLLDLLAYAFRFWL